MYKRKWLYRIAKVSGQSSWKAKYKAARNRTMTMLRILSKVIVTDASAMQATSSFGKQLNI